MYYTIYKITNILDQKFYIGMHKTANLVDNYFGSGKFLKRAIQKHGIESFCKEILFIFETAEEMYIKERELITEELVKNPMCYNLTLGGWGGNRLSEGSRIWSPEHMKSLSDKAEFSKKNNPEIRTRLKIKNQRLMTKINAERTPPSFTGKTHSDASKMKMSEAAKRNLANRKNNMTGKMWVTDGTENRTISKENEVPTGWFKGRTSKNTGCKL